MKTDEIEQTHERLHTYVQDEVLFIPSCLFFIRAIEIPEGLVASRIEQFLEMTLEELSPFSLEKLCWGYYFIQPKRMAFLYATTTERLGKNGFEEIDDYKYIFPHFLAAIPEMLLVEEGVCFFEEDDCYTIFTLQEDTLPKITFMTVDELANNDAPDKMIVELIPKTLSKKNRLSIYNQEDDEASIALTEGAAWQADIRKRVLTDQIRKERRLGKFLWIILQSVVITALVLLLFEGAYFLWNKQMLKAQNHIQSDDDRVSNIEIKNELLQELELAAEEKASPIMILEQLSSIKPNAVYFTGFNLDEENLAAVQGVANNVTVVSEYVDRLKAKKSFANVDLTNINSRQGKTYFTLRVSKVKLEVEN